MMHFIFCYSSWWGAFECFLLPVTPRSRTMRYVLHCCALVGFIFYLRHHHIFTQTIKRLQNISYSYALSGSQSLRLAGVGQKQRSQPVLPHSKSHSLKAYCKNTAKVGILKKNRRKTYKSIVRFLSNFLKTVVDITITVWQYKNLNSMST